MEEERQLITVGRRKEAVARVILSPGSGDITINGRPFDEYFTTISTQLKVLQPLKTTDALEKYDIRANVKGGGSTGQADAVSLGVARYLEHLHPEHRTLLKKEGLLTRNPRVKERKKYGRKRARKRFQFSKR